MDFVWGAENSDTRVSKSLHREVKLVTYPFCTHRPAANPLGISSHRGLRRGDGCHSAPETGGSGNRFIKTSRPTCNKAVWLPTCLASLLVSQSFLLKESFYIQQYNRKWKNYKHTFFFTWLFNFIHLYR